MGKLAVDFVFGHPVWKIDGRLQGLAELRITNDRRL